MAETSAKRAEWLVMSRKGPWEGYRQRAVVSFPPSFTRTFSSKERRLGTRQAWYIHLTSCYFYSLSSQRNKEAKKKIPFGKIQMVRPSSHHSVHRKPQKIKYGLWFAAMQFFYSFESVQLICIYFVAFRSPTTSNFIVLCLCKRFSHRDVCSTASRASGFVPAYSVID